MSALISRVTQGCMPVSSRAHHVTQADHNVVLGLDGEPALDVMLRDLSISLEQPQEALEVVRATLVGLMRSGAGRPAQCVLRHRTGNFGEDVTVRHIIGLDPGRRGIAVASTRGSGCATHLLPAQCGRRRGPI
jgi:small ligand-binding sensory domain FIST